MFFLHKNYRLFISMVSCGPGPKYRRFIFRNVRPFQFYKLPGATATSNASTGIFGAKPATTFGAAPTQFMFGGQTAAPTGGGLFGAAPTAAAPFGTQFNAAQQGKIPGSAVNILIFSNPYLSFSYPRFRPIGVALLSSLLHS